MLFIVLLLGITSLVAVEADSLSYKDGKQKKIYEIEGVTVTAQSSPATLGYSLKKDVNDEESAGALNVSDLINDLPGIRITTSGKGESELRIRNFTRSQTKIMLNGRPLNGGYFGNVDLHSLPINNIESISVVKGPVSSLYGANTLGGVVNIITPDIQPGWTNKVRLFLDNSATYDVSYSGSKGSKNTQISYRAARQYSPGFMMSEEFIPTKFENGERRNGAAYSRYSFGGGWNQYLGMIHNLDFQADYVYMDNKEIPSSIYENRARKYTDWHRYNLSLRYSVPVRHDFKMDATLYSDTFDNIYEEYRDTEYTRLDLSSDLRNNNTGIAINNIWTPLNRLTVRNGYTFERNTFKRMDNANYKEWKKGAITSQHLYVQPELTLFEDLTLTSGVGFSTFKLDELQYSIDPSVGLFYSFWNNKRLALAWSQNNRNPIMHELYSFSSGNPKLLPERAQKSELSLKMPFSNLVYNSLSGVFNFSIYHNDIKNLIERKIRYENIYRAKNSGIETDIALRVIPQWLMTVSYGRILSEDMSDFSLLRVPEHTVILSNKLAIAPSLTLFHESKYISEAVDRDHADRMKTLDPYTLHKLNLSYKYRIANFSIGVENIFDINYTEKYGFPSAGRSYFFLIELG
ncbi:MAG: TonB-dependent receptor plug domain-containing protein [Candidatus Cloacimonadia bacterium]